MHMQNKFKTAFASLDNMPNHITHEQSPINKLYITAKRVERFSKMPHHDKEAKHAVFYLISFRI